VRGLVRYNFVGEGVAAEDLKGMVVAMETVTYSQVQELVMRLSVKKLPIAYRMLIELDESDADSQFPQTEFMLLPVAERQRLMAEQAQQMATHYEQTAAERQSWQAGDFFDH